MITEERDRIQRRKTSGWGMSERSLPGDDDILKNLGIATIGRAENWERHSRQFQAMAQARV